jgi:hypothetical protein
VAEYLSRVIGYWDIIFISRLPMCGTLNVPLVSGAALACFRVRDIVPRSLDVSLRHRPGLQVGRGGILMLLCDGAVSVPMTMQSLA